MASRVTDTIKATCTDCNAIKSWKITHRYIRPWGITHCWECPDCGKVVPEFAWDYYVQCGRVVTPV